MITNHLLLVQQYNKRVPIFLKIAPDVSKSEIESIVDLTVRCGFDGITATNTTVDKSSLSDTFLKNQQGGLSGQPLFESSNNVLQYVVDCVQQKREEGTLSSEFGIIGVGGVFSAKDAKQKHAIGADLVQVYTGFIYKGPWWVAETVRALTEKN